MKTTILACLCIASLLALDPPPPIQGTPSLTVGKSFSSTCGNTTFSFTFPEKWGIETTSATESGGEFSLFPAGGGFGCRVNVTQFANETLAKAELERLKATFAQTSSLANGFETVVGNARYASYSNERYLTQIWYSLPKNNTINGTVWEQLKQCVFVSEIKFVSPNEKAWVAVQEIPWKGWACNHPNNQLHVLLESNFIRAASPSKDPNAAYLLQVADLDTSGFFYIKWDQKDLQTPSPYQEHLNEMKSDIFKLEKGQKFVARSQFNQEEGWALLKGTPYSIVSLSGDGFLFGFALKREKKPWPTSDLNDSDFNSYIKRVKWWQDGK